MTGLWILETLDTLESHTVVSKVFFHSGSKAGPILGTMLLPGVEVQDTG